MWTRERWLTIAELCGFAAIACAVGVAVWTAGNAALGVAAGLFVAGVEMVYLANAYALQVTASPGETKPEEGGHA